MRIESRFDLLPIVRNEAIRRALGAGFAPEEAEEIGLCVHEATMNAIEHGNAMDPRRFVSVLFYDDPDCLAIEVIDEGTGIPHEATLKPSSPIDARGRGIELIRALMDEVILSELSGRVLMRRFKHGRDRSRS